MLTNNGRLFLLPTAQSCTKKFKAISGSEESANDSTLKSTFANATYGGSILLGTGTTTPTKNDYTLEQPLESSIQVSVLSRSNTNIQSPAQVYSDVPSLLYVTALVTNESEADVTISEIGMTTNLGSNYTTKTLLTRTVLDEPIVMESGKTYQITVAIN